MAQHLPIQARHQFQLKTSHQNAQNNSVSAWPGPHAARRNCSRPPGGIHLPPGASVLPDPTVFLSPPGGAHHAARRLLSADPLTLRLSPGGVQWTARRHTSSSLLLVLAPKVVNYAIPECFRRYCTLVLSELLISNTIPSQV